MQKGIQISSFKSLLTSKEGVKEVFAKIKEMGCEYVQLQWISPSVEIGDIAEALLHSELNAVSVQEIFTEFDKNREYYFALCRACNCEALVLSRIPKEYKTEVTLKEYANILCEIHEVLKIEGQHLSFHPVKDDYENINGVCKLDILLQYLPEDVTLCLDLYHVEHAGLSISDTIQHYGKRVTEVHFKDYVYTNDGEEQLVPAGQGVICWDGVVEMCLAQNVAYAYVEQERWNGNPYDCLEEAFLWLLKENGEKL